MNRRDRTGTPDPRKKAQSDEGEGLPMTIGRIARSAGDLMPSDSTRSARRLPALRIVTADRVYGPGRDNVVSLRVVRTRKR